MKHVVIKAPKIVPSISLGRPSHNILMAPQTTCKCACCYDAASNWLECCELVLIIGTNPFSQTPTGITNAPLGNGNSPNMTSAASHTTPSPITPSEAEVIAREIYRQCNPEKLTELKSLVQVRCILTRIMIMSCLKIKPFRF